MNKIQQLIEELCPDGVEVKKIQDVCRKITSGGTPLTSRSEYYNGTIPWLRTQEIDWLEIFDTNVKITEEGLKNSSANWIPANCVIVAMYGATAAKVGINKIPLTTNQACCNLEIDYEQANYRYVYYWLCHEYQNLKALGEGAQFNINGQKVKNYEIPIPPLPIQQEIVKILDTFTALDATLQAELQARRKQYEHYRNELLNFEGKDVEWKTLGEVGEVVRGTGLQKNDFVESGIGCIHYGQIYTYYASFVYKTKSFVTKDLANKLKKVNTSDLIITTTSENVEDVCKAVVWLGDEDVVTGAHAAIFKHNQNAKFLTYYFQTDDISKQKKRYAKGAKVIEIKTNEIAKFIIPIPPLSEQERIVSILDKFDALVNIELPAEIEARRKQYEYYREKLLTFESLVN